jgi:hypothetical protein
LADVDNEAPDVRGPPDARLAPGTAVWSLPVVAGLAGPAACLPNILLAVPLPPSANAAACCPDFFGFGVITESYLTLREAVRDALPGFGITAAAASGLLSMVIVAPPGRRTVQLGLGTPAAKAAFKARVT